MTVKLFSAGDWAGVPFEQHQIKVASGCIKPGDAKTAEAFASSELLHWMKQLPLHDDCYYVHKVAMGGSHRYGPNRWGDGFREEVLKRDHVSFETDAKAYRNHKADGPYYGHVKIARFNDDQGIVELVTEYYATPGAARRNGGRVADDEIEMLHKQGYIPVSMGSMVPGDQCCQCGHWAPKPKDRCTSKEEGGNCTLFGCKTGMLKVAPDGRMNYVDNPKNRFYDISKVNVGADPVANGILLPLGAMGTKLAAMQKEAAFAEQTASLALQPRTELEQLAINLAYHWAELEPKTAEFQADDLDNGYATHSLRSSAVDLRPLHGQSTQRYRDTITQLIDRRELPDFCSFCKAAGMGEPETALAASYLPNLFTRIVAARQLLPVIKRARIFKYSGKNLGDNFALSTVAGLDSRSVVRRTLQANAEGVTLRRRKLADFDSVLPDIVLDYAAMKLAFIAARETVDPLVLLGVVRRDLYEENTR